MKTLVTITCLLAAAVSVVRFREFREEFRFVFEYMDVIL